MKVHANFKLLQKAFLAAGALVVLPLSANAMITHQDILGANSISTNTVIKEASGELEQVMANRFGTYSGSAARGAGKARSGTTKPSPWNQVSRDGETPRYLP